MRKGGLRNLEEALFNLNGLLGLEGLDDAVGDTEDDADAEDAAGDDCEEDSSRSTAGLATR